MDSLFDDTRLPENTESHPAVRAALDLQPLLRSYQREIEEGQRMPPKLAGLLHEAGAYRLTIPRSLGGSQADPLTYVRVAEILAAGVGSVGWNIANNGLGQLITLGLPDDGVEELYGNRAPTVMAGTAVQGGGQAVKVAGGYRVTGHWTFGSGCQESSWMLGSFQVSGDDGQPVKREIDGGTYWRGVFRRDEVTVLEDSWDVAGLRGTGSFDWTVKDVFLPERRVMGHFGVPLDNQWSRHPGVTYSLPAQCWVGPHHSGVITGLARAGIDALIELTQEKAPRGRTFMLRDSPQVQEAIGRADALLNAGRSYRAETIREIWATVAAGQETTLYQRARARLASTNAADAAREAMDLVYRQGGSTSFKRASRLAECWRDLHVVGQTVTIGPEWYPIAARALMGMDTGPRLR